MFAWLLNIAYLLFLLLVSPLLIYRMVKQGKYRTGWSEKLSGNLPQRDTGSPAIWFHAVSVGEVLALQKLVSEFATLHPDVEIVITTTTPTGLSVAREKYPDALTCFFPFDFSWAVKNAIDRIQPSAIVLVELELWPNFIRAASDLSIPLALINGRISEKSFRGYSRIRWLMKSLLPRFNALAVQNETYANRLKYLGTPAEKITVTGSVKYDHVATDRDNPRTQELQTSFGFGEENRIVIAGSTQAPEEQYILDAFRELRNEFASLQLVIVPRHQERFEEVARLIEENGFDVIRRTIVRNQQPGALNLNSTSSNNPSTVYLLDTLGELSACWGLAEIAFVGGSLENQRGGQNMIEPAGYGAAVLFGPNTWNFKQAVELLLDGDAARVVVDRDDLRRQLESCLNLPDEAQAMGQRAQLLILAQQGATQRTLGLISELLRVRLTLRGRHHYAA